MSTISVFDMAGKQVSETELSDAVFGIEPNQAVMHAMVVNYLANQRQGTQSTLTRTEVRGGGRKPWRQKGTGHARQGSTRAPQWTHGGVALGPKPRDYSYSLNKKVKRLAMKSALSTKVIDNNLIVLDSLTLDSYKTKTVVEMLKALGVEGKALIVT
ncbi:MAG: 50S ribosomal protein L4, partial [Ruminococcus sp.]|nr:50S ribosomal protein L4 [Ruminococcus sp.]